ncbi:hypothetical protein BGE01nite_16220 [Brevifollis gellanilyticus]|uniref:Uncharacterized protein n=2 Tax=Brevifollis gellanilyticus TaxID=748831 RepID=A0A512M7L0_9BACT|nr:hypothetical protein BGE01nite_16220 [Brevifollis gellanilyticus]
MLMISPAQADILLGAPGVAAGTKIATKVPFMINHALPGSYKFIFSGIEARGDTLGAPGASGTNGNGGQFHLQATVSGGSGGERLGKIEFRDVQDYNTAPLKTIPLAPVAVFRATTTPITINLQWKGNGNAHKPNGIFNILGEYQKDPPIPTGSLKFGVGRWILEDNPNPAGVATIVRE